jgi:hypothetical protein
LEMRTWRKHMKKGKENDAGFGGTRWRGRKNCY